MERRRNKKKKQFNEPLKIKVVGSQDSQSVSLFCVVSWQLNNKILKRHSTS